MSKGRKVFGLVTILTFLLVLAGFAQERTGSRCADRVHSLSAKKASAKESVICPMQQEVRSDERGKCCPCGIELEKTVMRQSQTEGLQSMKGMPMAENAKATQSVEPRFVGKGRGVRMQAVSTDSNLECAASAK